MRYTTIVVAVLLLLITACGDDKRSAAPPAPAAPGSRGPGDECAKPEDCQEGLWCLNGRCSRPLNRGMERKEEMEQMQDERYEQLDDKVRSIEEKMLR
ncbi:MAG: hypothetical protein ABIK09_06815 [Pseudomonadota bacterium]